MAFFGDEWIHELLSRVNVADLIGEYVTLQNKGGRLWACCPFHNEKTASFTVNADKGFFHCFGCGKGGNAVHFLMEHEKMTFPEACTYLADKVELAVPENTDNEQYEKRKTARKKIYEMNKLAAHYFYNMLNEPVGVEALKYLNARGIDNRIIKIFGIGYSGNTWDGLLKLLEQKGYTKQDMQTGGLIKINDGKSYDLFRNRVMMPIINTFSDVIGFGGRVLDDSMPKYLNSPETAAFNKSRNLYNLNMVRRQKDVKQLILVEGYMDVIALYMYGIPNCVATLGTAITQDQARLIKRYVNNVYISYDGDFAGKKAALRALGVLAKEGIESRVVSIPKGEDPDEFLKQYGKDGYLNLVKTAKPEMDYRFDVVAEQYDFSDAYQKEKYTKECINILKQVDSAVVKEKYIKKLSEKTGFSEGSIMQDMKLGTVGEKVEYKPSSVKTEKSVVQNVEYSLIAALCNQPDRVVSIEKYLREDELVYDMSKKIYSYLLNSTKKGFLPRSDEILSVLENTEDIGRAASMFENYANKNDKIKEDSFISACIKRIKLHNKEKQLGNLREKSRAQMSADEKRLLGLEIGRVSSELYEMKQSLKGE